MMKLKNKLFVLIMLAFMSLAACASISCQEPLEFQFEEFGFIDCGMKTIESEGVEKEYKVWCITDTDKKIIEIYYLLTQ